MTSKASSRVLVVDQDPKILCWMLGSLRDKGYEAYGTSNTEAAETIIPHFHLDAVICRMPVGLSIIADASDQRMDCRFLLLSTSTPDAVLTRVARRFGATVRVAAQEAFADEALTFLGCEHQFAMTA